MREGVRMGFGGPIAREAFGIGRVEVEVWVEGLEEVES